MQTKNFQMKKLVLVAASTIVCNLAFAQTGNPAPYCVSQFDNNYNMIQSVSVNATNFATGAVGSWPAQNSYTFFNNATFPSLAPGSTATIAVSFYSVTDWEPRYFGVWIDFNNNQTFDNSELVMNNAMTTNTDLPTGGGASQMITLPITIPATAVTGTTRMRVVRGQASSGSPYLPYSSTTQVLACNPIAANQAYGCTYDFNLSIAGANVPLANFSISPSNLCSGKPVFVSDQSSNTPNTWTWTAAGATNSLSSAQNPTLSFASAGLYTISLVSANASGISTVVSKTIAVFASPQLSLTPLVTSICAKKSLTLSANGASTYSWNSGSTQPNTVVSPSVTTIYTVVGTSTNGCSSSLSKTVTVSACTNIGNYQSIAALGITLFPNPGNGRVKISIESGDTEFYICTILNAIGQNVKTERVQDKDELNLSNFEKGIYFIQIANANGNSVTQKYVLQ